MKRAPKKAYLGIFALSLILFLLSLFLLAGFLAFPPGSQFLYRIIGSRSAWQNANIGMITFAIVSGLLFLIVQLTITLTLIYKMWAAIEDGHARTTPGKAIGFLFIPFFNLYWIFQIWGGFPTDYNAFVDRYQLPAPHLSSGIYIAYPIFILLSLLPFVGIVIAFSGTFVFFAIISKTCDAVNLLNFAVQQQRRETTSHALIQNQAMAQ